MPARKNRPGKFGYQNSKEKRTADQRLQEVIRYFVSGERTHPGAYMYPPFAFQSEVEALYEDGMLETSPHAAGSAYKITHKFWMAYLNPTR